MDKVTTGNAFNADTFVRRPNGTYGNVGPNTLIGPSFVRRDFSSLKNFKMPYAEGHQLQFPDANVLSRNCGKIRGTRGDMRNPQVAFLLAVDQLFDAHRQHGRTHPVCLPAQ